MPLANNSVHHAAHQVVGKDHMDCVAFIWMPFRCTRADAVAADKQEDTQDSGGPERRCHGCCCMGAMVIASLHRRSRQQLGRGAMRDCCLRPGRVLSWRHGRLGDPHVNLAVTITTALYSAGLVIFSVSAHHTLDWHQSRNNTRVPCCNFALPL